LLLPKGNSGLSPIKPVREEGRLEMKNIGWTALDPERLPGSVW